MTQVAANDNDKDEGRDWPQIFAIITASLVALSGGILFTWPSPSIPILISEDYPIKITLDEASYLTILPAIAVIVASPLSGRIIDVLGRKKSLIFISVPQLIAWGLIAYGGSIYVFYTARIFNGIADSCSFAAVPCYITEVSTPKVRGTWGNAITFCIYTGNLLMNVVGSYLSIRYASYTFAALPVIFLILSCFLPETPYFLLMKGRTEEAKKSLQWLRRKQGVDDELKQLTADVDRQLSEPGRFKDLFKISSNRRAIFIGVILRGAQQYSGIAAIMMYTQIIFEKSGSTMSATTSAIIISGFLVLTNLATSCVLEKIGRRIPMVLSCIGSGATLALLTVYFYLNDNTEVDLEPYNLVPLIMMILYMLFYSIGLGIVPTLMLGELFSSSIKGKALCVMNTFFGLSISTSSKLFSFLLEEYGMFVPFGFFALCNFLGAVASHYFVPETKGKTLEQIQQVLKSKSKKKSVEKTRY